MFDLIEPSHNGAPLAVLAIGRQEGLGLDRIAQHRAGPVRLDHVDLGGGETRVGQRLADHPLLRGPIGCGQAVGRPVLVHRRSAHDPPDPAPVAQRIGETLEHHHADALGEPGPVGPGPKGLAPPVPGQAALEREGLEQGRRRHHRHPAGEGEVALS